MRFSFLSLLALALVAAGCVTARAPSGGAGLVGPTWQLTSIGGDAPAGPDASITFGADGRVSGTAGCNRITGPYELEAGRALTLGPLAVTRMACAPDAMAQEQRVLDALADVERAEVEGDRLALLDDGGDALLTFRAAGTAARGTATLTGAVTYLPRIALPPDAVVTVRLLDVSLADAPSVTLAEQTISTEGRNVPVPFALAYDDSEIEARRRYVVRAEIRDGSGGLIWTTDTAYPVLTNGAPSSGVEIRVVQVEPASGATGGLVGPEWRLREIEAASGVVLSLDPGAPYTLTFGADGRYSGQADCNRIGGAFDIDMNGDLTLSQGLSTLAACPPGSASGDFLRVLNGAGHFDVSVDRLVLRGEAGTLVLVRDSQGGMPPQETGRDFAYTCESPDDPFTFRIRTGPGEIALWLPERFEGRDGGTYRVLGQVRSASGARYQDGPVTVWTHQGEALLEVDGETFTGCRGALR